jgi:formylglycine-generating enzyme required for sulfatase activity
MSTPLAQHAQVRVREPLGERVLAEGLTLGGAGCTLVVPGAAAAPALTLERRGGAWVAVPHAAAAARINGSVLEETRELTRDDVLTLGDAQLVVTDVSRTLLHLWVCHLGGNATVPPAGALAALPAPQAPDEDLEIEAPVPLEPRAPQRPRLTARQGLALAAVLAPVLVALAILAARLRPVPLSVWPAAAHVRTPGTWVALRRNGTLWLLPGEHTVTAAAEGYAGAAARVTVGPGSHPAVRLRLSPLPGRVRIDTAGVTALASIDGVAAGQVPGTLEVAAGTHTLVLRAPRHLDYVTRLDVQGARRLQEVKAVLASSWGTLKISSVSAGARVRVDGVDGGAVPATVAAPSGVHDIQIYAQDRQSWRSSVVLKAGEILSVGPVALGEPDAHLSLTSVPSGADVTVAGTSWGRTPAHGDLPAGVAHWVVLSLPGYASWSQSVFADPGRSLALTARLTPQWMSLTVRGQPAGAELLVDGMPQGHTPQVARLQAVDHRIEVRAPGYLPFEGNLGAAAGLSRTLEYRLMAVDRIAELLQHAPELTTGVGAVLRLVPPGAFPMGSSPTDPGHRPDEPLRHVQLTRPFYLGATEVTNAQFRQFNPTHSSGSISGRSIDHDDEPVTGVSWEEAAAFCNWLSLHDGLTPAYEPRDGHLVLRRPVTIGYRLPTEAEWEYAARYVAPGKFQAYAWGDALPVPPQAGNLAGAESSRSLPASLAGYRDSYPVVAPVAQFRPSALGLYDLAGNVSEWVNDYYAARLDPLPGSDPLGPEAGDRHSVRGSSWQTASPAELRLAWRGAAQEAAPTIGLRIARYADL